MAKKKETPVKNLQGITPIQDPVTQRRNRCSNVSKKITNVIVEETRENGDLSIFELTDIFAKLIHQYNKRFLESEYKQINEPQTDK